MLCYGQRDHGLETCSSQTTSRCPSHYLAFDPQRSRRSSSLRLFSHSFLVLAFATSFWCKNKVSRYTESTMAKIKLLVAGLYATSAFASPWFRNKKRGESWGDQEHTGPDRWDDKSPGEQPWGYGTTESAQTSPWGYGSTSTCEVVTVTETQQSVVTETKPANTVSLLGYNNTETSVETVSFSLMGMRTRFGHLLTKFRNTAPRWSSTNSDCHNWHYERIYHNTDDHGGSEHDYQL